MLMFCDICLILINVTVLTQLLDNNRRSVTSFIVSISLEKPGKVRGSRGGVQV